MYLDFQQQMPSTDHCRHAGRPAKVAHRRPATYLCGCGSTVRTFSGRVASRLPSALATPGPGHRRIHVCPLLLHCSQVICLHMRSMIIAAHLCRWQSATACDPLAKHGRGSTTSVNLRCGHFNCLRRPAWQIYDRARAVSQLPGPKCSSPLGYFSLVERKDVHRFATELAEQLGPIFKFRILWFHVRHHLQSRTAGPATTAAPVGILHNAACLASDCACGAGGVHHGPRAGDPGAAQQGRGQSCASSTASWTL